MSESFVPRLLSRRLLCAYLGDLPWAEVVIWIEAGRLPRPLDGASMLDTNARWDAGAIDRAIDDASSGVADMGQPVAQLHWATVRH